MRVGMPARSARSRAPAPATFEATAAIGSSLVDQRLEVRAASRDEDADHASSAQATPSIPSSRAPMTVRAVCGASSARTTAQ